MPPSARSRVSGVALFFRWTLGFCNRRGSSLRFEASAERCSDEKSDGWLKVCKRCLSLAWRRSRYGSDDDLRGRVDDEEGFRRSRHGEIRRFGGGLRQAPTFSTLM
ncbi:Uncharacterized protein Rs2_09188 [Raphanus sativus]|nr:Uncharacterized protein Rs2_09188 [Raphanus sativus]